MNTQVIAHTSFIGHTGYNNHSRNFFTHLNDLIPVRVRNYTYQKDISYLKPQELALLIEQKWQDPPYKIGSPFNPNPNDTIVNIVLNESNHYYFYDKYESPMIAYNVWESTKQIPQFFNRILEYDQFWCPTEWQRQCTIDQGYPEDRVKVVPEAVNGTMFRPMNNADEERKLLYKKYGIPEDTFTFMIFGRWDYRKSITELFQAFLQEFKDTDNVMLIASVDNPFSVDGLNTTEERLKHYGVESDKIKILHFPDRPDYIKWMQLGNIYLSCSRSEGWNLPLMEAIACGTPSICSGWGAQLEFADGIAHTVNVPKLKKPENVFMMDEKDDMGYWGEPDFDHLQKVMRDVYNDYEINKNKALSISKRFREKWSWENAAHCGSELIDSLVKRKLYTVPETIQKFNITYELMDYRCPKVYIKCSEDCDKPITVKLKDFQGKNLFQTQFNNVRKGLQYWLTYNKPISKLEVEVCNSDNKILHTERKVFTKVELYQDQYLNDRIIEKGKTLSDPRYQVMKQVFSKYKRPFTILDVGASFGYYSIRAAIDYDAIAVMIERGNRTTNILKNLCIQNRCGRNLIILKTNMDLKSLEDLSKCEHFDVVLALNVMHHFKTTETEKLCKVFESLGDNLILETPPLNDTGACGKKHIGPLYNYFHNKGGVKLGEFPRHTSKTTSEILWFENKKKEVRWPYYGYEKLFDRKDLDVDRLKNRDGNVVQSLYDSKTIKSPRREEIRTWIPGINLHTFIELNGIFPEISNIIQKIKYRDIISDYKWDNTNRDLVLHNLILNGHDLHLIDYDDELIEETTLTDEEQLSNIVSGLLDRCDIPLKEDIEEIKLNLGCGNVLKGGYVNIDKYNNTGKVDIKCDINDLPFQDESVSEIYTSHVFEHIPLNEMYDVLTEWRRVLKEGGGLVLRLPDLETEVRAWLNTPDDKKWTEVHRIFGSQSHAGNTHYCGFNPASLQSFLESFNFKITNVGIGNRGYGNELQCNAIKLKDSIIHPNKFITHFVDGPFVDIQGDASDKAYYQIDFLDPDNESSVHQTILQINHWTRPFRKYFTNWLIKIKRNEKLVCEHQFDLKGKTALINFDSKSLGDTLAWIPHVDLFRKKHECNVILSTFWNNLFEGHPSYKDLTFIKPGTVVDKLYASYSIGCYDDNLNKNVQNWRTVPLSQVCSDVLGLPYNEIIPDIAIKPEEREIKEKYVTLSEWSTFQCKHWNYKHGWQTVVDWLNDNGYKVVVISKEETNLKNVINRTNRPINHTITTIYHSEMFLGVSAGPAWLAWALRKPVIMISGFSHEFAEFETNIERIINKNVCHGCFNSLDYSFDRGDWNWCPRKKKTYEEFICTRSIHPDRIIDSIKKIAQNK